MKRDLIKNRNYQTCVNAPEMDSRWHIFLLTEGWSGLIDVTEAAAFDHNQQILVSSTELLWVVFFFFLLRPPAPSSDIGWNVFLGK